MLIALVLFTGPARAAALPTLPDLQKQLTGADHGSSEASAEKGQQASSKTGGDTANPDEKLQQLQQQTQQLRQEISDNQQQIESLKQLAAAAPAHKQQLQQQLQQARHQKNENWEDRYRTLSLPVLTQELVNQLNELESNQQQLVQVSSQLTRSQTLPERAQNTISDSLARIDEIRARLSGDHLDDNAASNDLDKAQNDKLNAELEALKTRIELRNQELNKADAIEGIAQLQKRLLQIQAATIQKRLDALQPLINEKRAEALRDKVGNEQVSLPPALADHPLLKAARKKNQAISKQLEDVGKQVNDLMREGIAAKTQLERLRALSSTVKDQIRLIDGSLLLSRILYEQQKGVPELKPQKGLDKRISETRLAQFDINQQRQQLDGPEPGVDDPSLDDDQRGQLLSALERLREARRQLLEQLDQEQGRKLNTLIHLQLTQQQLKKIASDLRSTISEQTFWMPSTQPLSLEWVATLPAQMKAEFQQMPWRNLGSQAASLVQEKWPWLFVPLVPALLLWLLRGRLRVRVRRFNADIGFLRRDSQLHTPLSILYSALMCAPGPLIVGLLAWGLWSQPGSLASVLGSALLKIALLWLVFELCYRLLASNGIAQRQFRWSRAKNQRLRRQLFAVGLTMVPMTLIIAFGEQWPSQLTNDRVGLILMIVCLVNLSVVLSRAALSYPARHNSRGLRIAITLLCALIPLVLVVLIALGYYYTSARLAGRMIDSFYMLLVWILCDATAVRGLAVAAQRLAYKRAVAQREAEARDSGSGLEGIEVEEPQLDLQQVNQQSLRLIRLVLFAGFGLLLYLVWADIFHAFSYTDRILLWSTTQGQGAAAATLPISLGDVMTALTIAIVTLVLASNLPGLLEVLLLSRLTLRPGTSYAATTLLSYLIIMVGIVITLGALGLSWGKLQWLVAALGVGLGFGLQEIFANFISGIIILFERPVRIGDIITLNDLTGTVSRIHIRATTLIDFDRKEIIVPNKAFVTERLVNWTLSDTIIRVTLKIGFAYGSDVDAIDALLRKVTHDNPRVLHDPEPIILFMSFGNSTLNYEARVYLRDIGDMLSATNELNHAIDKACRAQGIEIAFNQLDVHLRTASDEFQLRREGSQFSRSVGYHYGDIRKGDGQQDREPGAGDG